MHEYTGIWVITQFENHGKYRESKVHLRQVTETIDDDAHCNKVRINSIEFHLVKKGDGSGIVLHLHKGPQPPSKFDFGRNRTLTNQAIQMGNRIFQW